MPTLDNLDLPTETFLAETATEIRRLLTRSGRDVWEIGKRRLAVKRCLPHGEFVLWVEREFKVSADTAGRFMKVATAFPNLPQGAEFEATALYALSSGNVSDETRQQYVARAEAGEPITARQTRVEITTETTEYRVVRYVPDPDASRPAGPVIDVTPSEAPVVTGEPEPASGAPPPPTLTIVPAPPAEPVDDRPSGKAVVQKRPRSEVGQVADIVFQATLSVRQLRRKYRAGQIAADVDGGALAFRLQLMADELAKAAREIEAARIAAARKGSKTT